MKTIPLTQGNVALIDDDDLERVIGYSWQLRRTYKGVYAATNRGHGGSSHDILMHRLITQAPTGIEVDHIDFNGLNNQKYNLRLATHSENARHRGLTNNNTSGFKGVSWHAGMRKWRARIAINRQEIIFGYFGTPEEAAKCYDENIARHFGEFAVTNASLCLYPTKPTESL